MKTRIAAFSLVSVLLVPLAQAGGYSRGGADRDATDFAQVISTQPIYREQRVSEPREECWDERVVYRDQYRDDDRDDGRRYSSNAERTIGTVLGGVIGGVVGHQFSAGSGKKIATAIGAVVGADVARNSYGDRPRERQVSRERVAYEPRCRTIEQTRFERRIDGYDVTYRYNGQVYNTQLPYDPGARLPVRVEVSPLRY